MKPVIEILITDMSVKGTRMLQALADTAPRPAKIVAKPSGDAHTLVVYGVGDPQHGLWAKQHRAAGGRLVLWDQGYFAQSAFIGAMRMSIDHEHPQRLLDLAPLDSSRWDRLLMPLRNDYLSSGPIILVGLGPKTRAIVDNPRWELDQFAKLRKRFPKQKIIFRPKPRRPHPALPCTTDARSPIETLLRGASLVVAKHSNVCVDAVVAGIPFEAEDGAALWLKDKPYTPQNRLEFLWRLSWFNWKAEEAAGAWKMIDRCLEVKT